MLLEKFNELKDLALQFQYNSFTYLDYSEVKNYEIVKETDHIILIYGLEEDGQRKIYWATNQVNELLYLLKECGKDILISFIPEEWYRYLIEQGLSEYAIFREYWIEDLSTRKNELTYNLLDISECKEASLVTSSCRGQSRGFRGEQEEFFYSWLNGTDPSLEDGKHFNILVERDENNLVVGILCAAIYNYRSDKGPILWVREIAVKPSYQGKGYGRKLLKEAINYGIDKGAKRAFLMADDCNKHAIKLYKSLGFVPNDEIEINLIT